MLHVVRDRATLAQVLIVPVVQLLVLSNAATFAIRNTPAFIVDRDQSAASRRARVALRRRRGTSGSSGSRVRPSRADEAMLRGEATLILTIPEDFEDTIVRERRAPVQVVVNGEKGAAAGIVQSYAVQILDEFASGIGRPQPGRHPRIDVRTRGRYNQTLNYQHYMVPGLLVSLITLIGTLLTAQNIAREKELGTLEQLNVTPITRGEFITAKLLPFWGLGLLDFGIGLVVGRLVFGMPVRGSLLLLFGSAAMYLVAALAIGLWISTLVETQQQAMFVTFFIMIIYLLMSGLFTPIDSMAPWVQTRLAPQSGSSLRDDLPGDLDERSAARGYREAARVPGRLCGRHAARRHPAILQAHGVRGYNSPFGTVMLLARRYVVSGRVQGVGFRYFTEAAAAVEGVDGWVRNRPDGRVEIEVEGDADAVERFERRVRMGPPGARVDEVGVDEIPAGGRRGGFWIR